MPSRPQTAVALTGAAAALLLTAAGCYDGQVLVDRARHDALRTRIETIDLGKYAVTMPNSHVALGMTEVQVEPFGRTVRYKLDDLGDQIEENEYLLRHAVVMTVRSSEPEDFADPDLKRLRDRLLEAVQDALGNDAIQSIGFNQVRFVRH